MRGSQLKLWKTKTEVSPGFFFFSQPRSQIELSSELRVRLLSKADIKPTVCVFAALSLEGKPHDSSRAAGVPGEDVNEYLLTFSRGN